MNEIIASVIDDNNWSTEYSFDGNGNLLTLKRNDGNGDLMDDFNYYYTYNLHTYPDPVGDPDPDYVPGVKTTNRLRYVKDSKCDEKV